MCTTSTVRNSSWWLRTASRPSTSSQIAAKFLDATTDICPNWKLATPDPMVTVGVFCEGFPLEMIVRGYLCGSAWRAYKSGVREICGVRLPEGMKENQKFPTPIITPTTKAEIGEHDADISKEEILARGLCTPEEYAVLEDYTLRLFERGTQIAAERGLILVDTKYEFGKHEGKIYLMDEIHTPDSSRYFYSEGYEERFAQGEPQRQLSKEFVREWLMSNGFQGKEERLPGQGGTAGARDDGRHRARHQRPLRGALRAHHGREVRAAGHGGHRCAHRAECNELS